MPGLLDQLRRPSTIFKGAVLVLAKIFESTKLENLQLVP